MCRSICAQKREIRDAAAGSHLHGISRTAPCAHAGRSWTISAASERCCQAQGPSTAGRGSLLGRLERAFDPFSGNQTAHGIVAVLTDVTLAARLDRIVHKLHWPAAARTRLPYRKSRRHWTIPGGDSIVHPDARVSTRSREDRSSPDARTALLSSAPHRRRTAERASADPLQIIDRGLAVRRGFEKFRSDVCAGAGLVSGYVFADFVQDRPQKRGRLSVEHRMSPRRQESERTYGRRMRS